MNIFKSENLALYSILFIMLLSVIFTNRWLVNDSDMSIHQFDSKSYLQIAESAPDFPQEVHVSYPFAPDSVAKIPYHHAQRFAVPFAIGLVAHASNISVENIFIVFQIAFVSAILLLLFKIALYIGLPPPNALLLPLFFLCNPYTTRFFFAATPMIPDMVFMLGLTVILYGLVRISSIEVFLGVLIAIFGRQTALLLLPGIFLWIFVMEDWKKVVLTKKILLCSAVFLVISGWYFYSGAIASSFAGKNYNAEHLTGLIHWLGFFHSSQTTEFFAQSSFSLKVLGEFIFRGILSLLPALLTSIVLYISGEKVFRFRELIVLALLILSVIVQPFLAGPVITGNTIIRLTALALPILLVLLAKLLKDTKKLTLRNLVILFPVFLLATVHHRYTVLNLSSDKASIFALLLVVVACMQALLIRTFVKNNNRN